MTEPSPVAYTALRRSTAATYRAPSRPPILVSEPEVDSTSPSGDYEDEGSEKLSRGSVVSTEGARWMATLMVPLPGESTVAFLMLERRGDRPTNYRGDTEIEFSLPLLEIESVLALLRGIVTQARRDGVLRSSPANNDSQGS